MGTEQKSALTGSEWPDLAKAALEEARSLAGDVIAVLGLRALSGQELAVYRRAERLLDELERPC